MFRKSWGRRPREGWRERRTRGHVTEKGHSSAGAVASGLTQSMHREAGDGPTTPQKPASHRQTSSRAGILRGQRRVCKNPNHGDSLVFLALPQKPHNHEHSTSFPTEQTHTQLIYPLSTRDTAYMQSRRRARDQRRSCRRQGRVAAQLWRQQAGSTGVCKEPCLHGHIRVQSRPSPYRFWDLEGTVLQALSFFHL